MKDVTVEEALEEIRMFVNKLELEIPGCIDKEKIANYFEEVREKVK